MVKECRITSILCISPVVYISLFSPLGFLLVFFLNTGHLITVSTRYHCAGLLSLQNLAGFWMPNKKCFCDQNKGNKAEAAESGLCN